MEISVLLRTFNCGGRGKYDIIIQPRRGNGDMKTIISTIGIIVLPLAFAGMAKADMVELPLNCAGTYDINTPYRTIDFNLGVTFSEISNVYIDWSGEITAGLAIYYPDPCNPFPQEVGIRASLGGNPWPRLTTVWGGEETYPEPEPFDSLSEIPASTSTWSDLLDGQGTIRIQYEEVIMTNGKYIEHGLGKLDNATLIIEGTVIPEPASFFLFALGGLFLKRARK
jgi:hypothetical protein